MSNKFKIWKNTEKFKSSCVVLRYPVNLVFFCLAWPKELDKARIIEFYVNCLLIYIAKSKMTDEINRQCQEHKQRHTFFRKLFCCIEKNIFFYKPQGSASFFLELIVDKNSLPVLYMFFFRCRIKTFFERMQNRYYRKLLLALHRHYFSTRQDFQKFRKKRRFFALGFVEQFMREKSAALICAYVPQIKK